YYVPFVLVLLALIGRGVAFEFRSKVDRERWKRTWDHAIFIGSLLPPFLFGVVFAGLLKGLPIDRQMEMQAGWSDMVNPYTIVGGVTVTLLCLVHGLVFTTLKTEGGLRDRARTMAKRLILPLAILLILFGAMTVMTTDVFQARGAILTLIAAWGAVSFVSAGAFLTKGKDGWAFGMTGSVIVA